ncbi:lysine transporter LysE [Marinobacterium zhoushanense]|uniref:Lysine transporter LysE n=1 Tax=Marinobacterium zhoushanense TaxID=1679163 RepID=A0ABQ1K522_9GAMM|nr:LysE family transporter [Marinobacterium zhoushanense]GGB88540.1 lysine transporter LysE [Marinobacterium zhoushanense]
MLEWLLFLIITLGGAMIPGANLAIVLRNTLHGCRRDGALTILGLTCALLIHGTLSLLGITALIEQHPTLFEVMRWFGAGYLLLLGLHQLLKCGNADTAPVRTDSVASPFFSGLLISLFNPKVLIYFVAIFAQVLRPEQTLATQLLYMATPALAEVTWFTLLLTLLNRPSVQQRLKRVRSGLERCIGGAMIALGIKLGLG